MAAGLLGLGFGLGGIARLRRGAPSRGPGDRLSSVGLVLFGLLLALTGAARASGVV